MTESPSLPPVALVTYSTKPRGGVAHTLALGEALHALGQEVLIVGLGDPEQGFFRPVAAPTHVVPAPTTLGGLEEKVAANIDALETALTDIAPTHPILHTQDCISARAAARVRDAGIPSRVVRTVHHVDDFDSESLMDCQTRAILEPDRILVVTRIWEHILRQEYGVRADVVPNGVDTRRYRQASPELVARLRARVGASDRPMLLAVGGIEPRKGTDTLVAALSRLVKKRTPAPVLTVLGGHSFQDHRAYRDRVLASLDALDLTLGKDIIELGTVPEDEMAAWYAAADVLAFPSVKEGFGLAALEAMAAGVPVVTSDLPVFREWLVPGRDALLVPLGDPEALADALSDALDDQDLRTRLRAAALRLADRYTWTASARRHLKIYAEIPPVAP
ncbi:MSMEG_0565 family glycosyltransferase [Streptosporangium sp. NBC_01755]|uniref:MSMEG_0565 family glycosyltransferase n=1 Tax=unclassified Streptosporangium TaxID=2632669 RepID=UPI002DD8DEFE|nr:MULTISPECIES: MSMEG_0565 family glycosyltransferase [unclassified Streptosporangium]WSA26440.1 MSMEG_0565 family glycosyltransferase [Streptosporangium sp. NBC_01810]WSD02130.1 MSMEG_0565 family glycosyltransferase [Streptosporangium sp. NBC_01755]